MKTSREHADEWAWLHGIQPMDPNAPEDEPSRLVYFQALHASRRPIGIGFSEASAQADLHTQLTARKRNAS